MTTSIFTAQSGMNDKVNIYYSNDNNYIFIIYKYSIYIHVHVYTHALFSLEIDQVLLIMPTYHIYHNSKLYADVYYTYTCYKYLAINSMYYDQINTLKY